MASNEANFLNSKPMRILYNMPGGGGGSDRPAPYEYILKDMQKAFLKAGVKFIIFKLKGQFYFYFIDSSFSF